MMSGQWLITEMLGQDKAVYRLGSVTAAIEDDDGRAVYEVRRDGQVIASGGDPDLDGSIDAVEEVLVAIGWLYRAPEIASGAAA